MSVRLTEMAAGVFPYDDGSGFTFEVKIDKAGEVSIHQGGHNVQFTRKQWPTLRSAVDAMFETANQVAALNRRRAIDSPTR